jgi:hypothetical protein
MQPQAQYKKNNLLLVILGIVIVVFVVLLVLVAIKNRQFRIVSTNPDIKKIQNISPFIEINFNKELSSNNVSFTSNPPIIRNYKINGKTLTINLNIPLRAQQNYTINIVTIEDTVGHKITNKKLSFVPSLTTPANLPQDQQQAILQQQVPPPVPSKESIGFSGLDNLLSYGVTTTQENNLEEAFFKFSGSAKSVSIDPSSIAVVPHDPNSASMDSFINFSVKVDSKLYKAKIDYTNLTTIRLYLFDFQSGNQVYDSNFIST